MPGPPTPVDEPFPILQIARKYLLYDPDTIFHLRRNHNICGVLVGGLPQVPQQNVFLGIPLQLMPEEARLLVENGHAYIVDDAEGHKAAFLGSAGQGLSAEETKAFRAMLQRRGTDAALAVKQRAGERREQALKKVSKKERQKRQSSEESAATATSTSTEGTGTALFPIAEQANDAASTSSQSHQRDIARFFITPTCSDPPLSSSTSKKHPGTVPPRTPSYDLYAHLHSLGYFMMPGLRFGCEYNVYPGDPLRYHSHFLAVGKRWDEEFPLMEVVAGGRLGTAVKKGFMIGGKVEGDEVDEGGKAAEVRTFCVEWAGM